MASIIDRTLVYPVNSVILSKVQALPIFLPNPAKLLFFIPCLDSARKKYR